jgi:hypothetical protein
VRTARAGIATGSRRAGVRRVRPAAGRRKPRWVEAIGKCLGESGAEGFARLASTWKQRNLARFFEIDVGATATPCSARCARKEEVEAESFSLRDVFKANREARDRAREEAERRIAERLKPVYAGCSMICLVLHGIDPAAAGTFEQRTRAATTSGRRANPTRPERQGGHWRGAGHVLSDAMSGGLTLGAGHVAGRTARRRPLGGGVGTHGGEVDEPKSGRALRSCS